jgi:hypothetical protein
MKATKKQIELIRFCKKVLDTFENSEDIELLDHYGNVMYLINEDLDSYPYKIRDEIYDSLINILDTIKFYENYR